MYLASVKHEHELTTATMVDGTVYHFTRPVDYVGIEGIEHLHPLLSLVAPVPEELLGAQRSGKWRSVEKAHLLRQPTCGACGGRRFLQVHHVIPFSHDPSLELEASNLQTLCMDPAHLCHWTWGHLGKSWNTFNPDVIDNTMWWLKKREGKAA